MSQTAVIQRKEVAEDGLLTVHDAMRILRISRQTLHRLTNHKRESERLPSFRVGNVIRYRAAELNYWIENHRNAGIQPVRLEGIDENV